MGATVDAVHGGGMLIDLTRYSGQLPPPGFAPYAEAIGDTQLQFGIPAGQPPPAGMPTGIYPCLPPAGYAAIVTVDIARKMITFEHPSDTVKAPIGTMIIAWRRQDAAEPEPLVILSPGRDLDAAMELSMRIRPLLAGQPPHIIGAALADLLSIWVAGHRPELRQDVLRSYAETVMKLVPASVKEIGNPWQENQ